MNDSSHTRISVYQNEGQRSQWCQGGERTDTEMLIVGGKNIGCLVCGECHTSLCDRTIAGRSVLHTKTSKVNLKDVGANLYLFVEAEAQVNLLSSLARQSGRSSRYLRRPPTLYKSHDIVLYVH